MRIKGWKKTGKNVWRNKQRKAKIRILKHQGRWFYEVDDYMGAHAFESGTYKKAYDDVIAYMKAYK